jgi:hypothetical protein
MGGFFHSSAKQGAGGAIPALFQWWKMVYNISEQRATHIQTGFSCVKYDHEDEAWGRGARSEVLEGFEVAVDKVMGG